MEHIHGEAFTLMWYACRCGHRERIWNSRDGVTPFGGVHCPSCGGDDLKHIEWKRDEYAPKHALQVGQRFFRDGTADDAVAIIKGRLARFADMGHSPPPEIAEMMMTDAREQTGEWQKGWPMTDRCGGTETLTPDSN